YRPSRRAYRFLGARRAADPALGRSWRSSCRGQLPECSGASAYPQGPDPVAAAAPISGLCQERSPGPDLSTCSNARQWSTLLDDLVSACKQHGWDRETERFRRLEIDDEFERCGLLNGKVSRLGTFENTVHEISCPLIQSENVRSVAYESACLPVFLGA